MDKPQQEQKKTPFIKSIGQGFAQSLFSKRDTFWARTLKGIVRFGITRFHNKHGYMKDELIESEISFTAEELDAYQYPEGKRND